MIIFQVHFDLLTSIFLLMMIVERGTYPFEKGQGLEPLELLILWYLWLLYDKLLVMFLICTFHWIKAPGTC